jgi:hypothetical protein
MIDPHKRIFVCHPFKGDPEGNKAGVALICRTLAEENPDIIPISPIHAFSYLDDDNQNHRKLALGYCLDLLATCDELWAYGDWRESEGCRSEVSVALALGMPVRYFPIVDAA